MSVLKNIFNPDEFTGYHMLGVIVLFFGTIISVNMFLAFSASSTWTGLIVKNTYVESQNFNETLDRLEKQKALGWQATVTTQEGEIVVALANKDGLALENAIVTANLGRPVHEGEDSLLSFKQGSHGYTAPAVLNAGLWRLQIKAIGARGEIWVHTIRFQISNDGKVV